MRQLKIDLLKRTRLQIRIDEESCNFLRRAAQYENKKMSEFVRDVSLKKAAGFYQYYGFKPLVDRKKLFISVKTIEKLFLIGAIEREIQDVEHKALLL